MDIGDEGGERRAWVMSQ